MQETIQMSRQVTYDTRGTDLGGNKVKGKRKKKKRPALTGKHGSEGEEDGHGDGKPLSNALWRQEKCEP